MKKVILLLGVVLLSSCTDNQSATKALLRSNYQPLDVGGYGWFDGSKDDVFKTKFRAIAPNGDTITGCVTKGWFKGSTIRVND